MIFQIFIERAARKQASNRFFESYFNQEPLKSQEEAAHIARQEAEDFYQSGTILLFLKVSKVGTPQTITQIYSNAFLDQYELHNSLTTVPYNPLTGLPPEIINRIPPEILDQALQHHEEPPNK